MFRSLTIVALATLFAFSAIVSATAQQRFGFLGESLDLSDDDVELQRKTVRNALDNHADGKLSSWNNPDTGHSGRVQPISSYESDGLKCRDFKLEIVGARTRQLVLAACKQADGTWKLYF